MMLTEATDSRIKVAVQKSGRLTEHSLELLQQCGLKYSRGHDQLIGFGENMPTSDTSNVRLFDMS